MSPAMKPGGHQQGLKVTVITVVDPSVRALIEEEAAERKRIGREDANMADVQRDCFDTFFSGDLDTAEQMLATASEHLEREGGYESMVHEIKTFLNR